MNKEGERTLVGCLQNADGKPQYGVIVKVKFDGYLSNLAETYGAFAECEVRQVLIVCIVQWIEVR